MIKRLPVKVVWGIHTFSPVVGVGVGVGVGVCVCVCVVGVLMGFLKSGP